MTKKKFENGEFIFKEGEIGDKFYLIKSGKINVIKDLQKKIEQYKTERTKRYINNKENDEDEF